MSARQLFIDQLNGNPPVTEEILEQLDNPEYYNGEEIEPSDVVLLAIAVDASPNILTESNWTDVPQIGMEVIKLNERHLDYFDIIGQPNVTCGIPKVRLRRNELPDFNNVQEEGEQNETFITGFFDTTKKLLRFGL